MLIIEANYCENGWVFFVYKCPTSLLTKVLIYVVINTHTKLGQVQVWDKTKAVSDNS